MGLFTKNTMSLDLMARMMGFIAMAEIEVYAKSRRTWPDGKFRTNMVDVWMQETGHTASTMKLTKLAIYADNVAKTAIHYTPEVVDVFRGTDEEEKKEITETLSHMSRDYLLTKGMTS